MGNQRLQLVRRCSACENRCSWAGGRNPIRPLRRLSNPPGIIITEKNAWIACLWEVSLLTPGSWQVRVPEVNTTYGLYHSSSIINDLYGDAFALNKKGNKSQQNSSLDPWGLQWTAYKRGCFNRSLLTRIESFNRIAYRGLLTEIHSNSARSERSQSQSDHKRSDIKGSQVNTEHCTLIASGRIASSLPKLLG